MMMWAMDAVPLQPTPRGDNEVSRGTCEVAFSPQTPLCNPIITWKGQAAALDGLAVIHRELFCCPRRLRAVRARGGLGTARAVSCPSSSTTNPPARSSFPTAHSKAPRKASRDVFPKEKLNQPCGWYLLFTPCSRVNKR